MNDFNRHKKSDKIKWGLTAVAFLLLVVMLACVCLEVFGKGKVKPSEWFTKEEQQVEQDGGAEAGGMYIPETENGTGISLVSAVIPVSQYDEYGVMPIAESAQTLTATVQPDNEAENTKVKWEASFKNPASSWAEGKTVSDYLTLSFGDEYKTSKTCVVSCLQAFGEQIEIVVIAVDNPDVRATVFVDYVQKISDITLSFGTVNCVWGGNTDVKIEVNERGEGTGGMPNLSASYVSGTYTKSADVQVKYTLSFTADAESEVGIIIKRDTSYWYDDVRFGGVWVSESDDFIKDQTYDVLSIYDIAKYNVAEKGLRFSLKFLYDNMHLREVSLGRSGSGSEGDFSSLSSAVTFAFNEDPDFSYKFVNNKLFKLTVNVKNFGQEVTKETTFNATGYTNSSTITGLNVDQSQLYY